MRQETLHGTCIIDCRTGAFDFNPDVKVATFPVRIEGDDILADLP